MIITRLTGGLGNQMFQFAAGHTLALRLGSQCKVDVLAFKQISRRYALDCFTGAPQIATNAELPLGSRLAGMGLPAIFAHTLGRTLGTVSIFKERSAFQVDDRFLQIGDNSYLIGYFQSEKYFKNVEAAIRALFNFKDSPSSTNKDLLDQIAGIPSVSVHVRRGDYVTNRRVNRVYGRCSLEYYEAAFRIVADRVSHARFFVFSDDPAWVRENLKPPGETVVVSNNRDRAYEDMRLMSGCRHHIIANSSFSWWAAWLNPSSEKTVIAPRKWLNDMNVDTNDLLPLEWTRV